MNIAFYLKTFAVTNPELLSQTPRACLWRVDTQHGSAVLKVLSERGRSAGELTGARALEIWDGEGAVHLLALHDQATLYLPEAPPFRFTAIWHVFRQLFSLRGWQLPSAPWTSSEPACTASACCRRDNPCVNTAP